MIPSQASKYGVNCDHIKLRLNSALVFAVTAKSEGQLAPHEGCLCHYGTINVAWNLYLAKYFEPSFVHIFSFPLEIPLSHTYNHQEPDNDVFYILCHQVRVLCPLLGIGSRVGWLHR
jgi:hypothetical protein